MIKRVARHGMYSTENGGLLIPEGIKQARAMPREYRERFGVDPAELEAAISEAPRNEHTATEATFGKIAVNPLLNEIDWKSIPDSLERVYKGDVPVEALRAAYDILCDPPEQEDWFSHGFVIVGLCRHTGTLEQYGENVIPGFCEIREIPIG